MRILLTLLLMSMCSPAAFTQDYKKEEAKAYFAHQHYADALSVLKSAKDLVRADEEARFLMAVCYYQLNQLEAAEDLLSALMRESRSPYPECWLYRGKIAQAMHQFEKAAGYYKGYLRRLKPNHKNRPMAWDAIRRCATGMRLQYRRLNVVVENLGAAVNSAGDEFAPVLSPKVGNKLYFSAIRAGNNGGLRNENGLPDDQFGHFYSDMFSCRSTAGGGSWKEATPMHFLLNSTRHDVLLDFSADGSVLRYFRGWRPDQGQIFVDTFQRADERTLSSDPFSGPINANLGDGTPFWVGDTLILFSSRRPGGYGGLDLYRTALRNGRWTAPENLGPNINSPYDETTPFLARDGFTMYYSTNHPDLSIGGLDIVKVVYNPNSRKWTQPELLPPPLNSAGDDAYFRLAKDGFTAYFSSSRKDSYGKRDIYAAYFNDFLPEMEPPVSSANVPPSVPRKVQPDTRPAPTNLASALGADDKQQKQEKQRVVENSPPQKKRPAETAVFTPLSFEPASTALNQAHELSLKKAISALKNNSELGLVITAYSRERQSVGQQLFSAMRQAEQVAKHLKEEGIHENRLFLRASLASQNKLAAAQQVDLAFHTASGTPADLPSLQQPSNSFAVPQHPLNKPLLYKVQVGALKGAYNSSRIDAYDTPMAETTLGFPYYRYTLGAFETYAEAEDFRRDLLSGPFDSALIVAYIYGRRANHKLARQHLSLFPDLQNYTN
jgi:tetratricopeptide (TPR) repeat protein